MLAPVRSDAEREPTGPGSRPAGYSTWPGSGSTTGNGFTGPRSTSSCSTRSPGTWAWRAGSGSDCTGRSGGGCPAAGPVGAAGMGDGAARGAAAW